MEHLKAINEIDILITGCEVSLWVAEQFASDLSVIFPGLVVKALSANKLLALKGQLLPHPITGFAGSQWNLTDTLVIIVSHSGGTFAPLAVSNLLQPLTSNVYLVASEWDTQIGKQLRAGVCGWLDRLNGTRVRQGGLYGLALSLSLSLFLSLSYFRFIKDPPEGPLLRAFFHRIQPTSVT